MCSVDKSGRIAAEALVRALGWDKNDRVIVTLEPTGAIAFRRHNRAADTILFQNRLRIPINIRVRCGIQTADRVLVVARRDVDRMYAYTLDMVEKALVNEYPVISETER